MFQFDPNWLPSKGSLAVLWSCMVLGQVLGLDWPSESIALYKCKLVLGLHNSVSKCFLKWLHQQTTWFHRNVKFVHDFITHHVTVFMWQHHSNYLKAKCKQGERKTSPGKHEKFHKQQKHPTHFSTAWRILAHNMFWARNAEHNCVCLQENSTGHL